ncbi:hypothetical protein [Pseudaquabacterium pictum]|uniref:Uncharacterized protein n=1 Tax=Pseudaquabacterium pictum TaxID=2315236 RepID=A0A480AU77_9BURK|nr:hypothetical protein [Rubrivivax pictus]GCL64943.1 hypothetical protein AQPW35_40240 [Rubrivivax pictus]
MNARTTPPPARSPEARTADALALVAWQLGEVTDLLETQGAQPAGLPVGGVIELEYTAWNGRRQQLIVRRTK